MYMPPSALVPATCLQDSFYRRFKGSPFPEAIEANGSELAAVTQKVRRGAPLCPNRQPLATPWTASSTCRFFLPLCMRYHSPPLWPTKTHCNAACFSCPKAEHLYLS